MIAMLWAPLWAVLLAVGSGSIPRAEILLRGPTQGATLDCGRFGTTRVELDLARGEERRLIVPLAHRPLDDAPPEIAGGALFLGYREPSPRPARPVGTLLPPVGAEPPRADPLALVLVLVGALLVLACRRRPGWALAWGLCLGGAVALVQGRGGPAPPQSARLLEGELWEEDGGTLWELVEGAAGELACDPAGDLEIEVRPASAPIDFRGRFEGARAEPRWTVRSGIRGAALWRRAPLDVGSRRLAAEANLWGDLAAVWVRGEGGVWRARGSWPLGDPLPQAREGASPPGWLIAGLPMGRGALVARLDPAAWGGPPSPGTGATPARVWLRLVGFESKGER